MSPGSLIPIYEKSLVILIILFFALGFILKAARKRSRGSVYSSLLRRLSSFFAVNGIIGLFILFFTYESVYFLSSRFWFLIWGASMAAWLWFIFKAFFAIPGKKRQAEEEKEFKKYIP